MPLGAGAKLGPYEVLAPLGAGGMGEVYRARDTRLDRVVALKLLPDHLASNPDLRQRFEREARAIASLNHPHICTLFDIGHQDGTDYLVMEHLEGETLADRLERGPLPPDQLLRYGIEMADALDKAHRQGIIHRDLKPGNIMLTKSGSKLLDFGLAKLQAGPAAPTAASLSGLATAARPLTEHGTMLGTFQYMAPEQLEGQEADTRTDIFALGSILYEMATGKRAFTGRSQASLIAAILSADPPPLSSLQPMAPPQLERLVGVCLAKEPDDRLQTAHDVMQELKWIAEAGAPAPVAAHRHGRERLAWSLAAAFGLTTLALGLGVASLRRPPADVRPTRFLIPAPEKALSLDFANLSPDGLTIAFLANVEGKSAVWLRPLDSLEARLLAGTEGAEDHMWSGDGRSIAFIVNRHLKKVPTSGGPPIIICEASLPSLGEWGPEGTILFSDRGDGLIYRVSAAGGKPTAVTQRPKDAQEFHDYPSFLPDGRHFVYLARRQPLERSAIYLASLDSAESRELLAAESQALFSPPGFLLFVRGAALLAQPFDPRTLTLHGEPFALAQDLLSVNAYGDFSVSVSGILAFRQSTKARRQLTWLDRAGRPIGSLGAPGVYFGPALSPDAKRLAIASLNPTGNRAAIWLFDLESGSSQLTPEESLPHCSLWSRDGTRLLFGSGGEIHQKTWGGAGADEVVLKVARGACPQDVSPDGRFLIYASFEPKTGMDLWVLPLSGNKEPTELLRTKADELQAQLSPDGQWLAHVEYESGKGDVYVQPFPPTGARWQVSLAGGFQPRWRRDGKELFYLAPDATLMGVEVQSAGSHFVAGRPKPLFVARVEPLDLRRNDYVVGADGQRFLFAQSAEESGPAPITVVLNWATEHKQ